jgi:hypothetical protein
VQTDRGVELKDARVVIDPRLGPFRLVGFYAPTSGLAATKGCTLSQLGSPGCPRNEEVVSIDPEAQRVSKRIFENPYEVRDIRLDAAGRHFIWLTTDDRAFALLGWQIHALGGPYSEVVW